MALIASATAVEISAQHANVRFERYGTADGLSSHSVLAILQDRDGFIWFGTEDGLNRFDGATFIVYRHDPSDSTTLSDSWVASMVEGPAGGLWIGTRNRGINRFDRLTRSFTRYPYESADSAASLLSGQVAALLFDRAGRLWVGTTGGGLSRLDLKSGQFTHYTRSESDSSFTSNSIWCLYEDRSGKLWVGSWARGLMRLDPETGESVLYRADYDDPTALGSDRVRSVVEDRDGYIWVGTSGGGLNRLNPHTGRFKRFIPDPADPGSISHKTVWSVYEDSRGNIWAGTFGGGLNKFDRTTRTFSTFRHDAADAATLPSDVVLGIFEDRSGLLWLATDSGVASYNPARERIAFYKENPVDSLGLSHSDVLAITPSRRRPNFYWIGTNRGGLNGFQSETGRFWRPRDSRPTRSLGNLVVSAIAEDSTGLLWMGTSGDGLIAFNPITGRWRQHQNVPGNANSLSQDAVMSLLLDDRGNLWIGTDGGGLDRLDTRTGRFEHFRSEASDASSVSDISISALLQDSSGDIWIGTTNGGLNRYSFSGDGGFDRYVHQPDQPASLGHNRVHDLHEDEDGNLWVGTYGGLSVLPAGQKDVEPDRAAFRRYSEGDGLAGSVIYGVAGSNDGVMWISTNRGVSRLETRFNRITNYGLADGFQGRRFNPGAISRTRRGEIIIGGPGGMNLFHPRALQQETFRPPLVITAFKKFGELAASDFRGGPPLRLSHSDNYFSFEFALLDYTSPAEHTFRYKLDSFDAEWQEVRGPIGHAHYRNLEGRDGTFVFRIQGVDSKGRASEVAAVVTIVPPWWRTRWFRAFSLIGSFLLIGAVVAFGYVRKQQELAEKARMLAESREQERHFLARELHDLPLQNLYSVRHRIEIFSRGTELNGQADELLSAQSMLEQTVEELRRICGDLRPPAIGPFGLSRAIRAHLRTFEEAYPEIRFDFELDADGQTLPEPMRLALFRIYQGGVANAVRHAGANQVWVRLRLRPQNVVLEVEDDGQGFVVPKSWLELARQRHYGLLGIAEWAETAGGQLVVRSSPGQGATLQVSVPLREPALWRASLPSLQKMRVWVRGIV